MPVVVLLTDFGWEGPYVGQMLLAARAAASVEVVSLMHDLPAFAPRSSAYLAAAVLEATPGWDAAVVVVDPGVGSARKALAIETARGWLVGPDNGVLSVAARRFGARGVWALRVPEQAAPSFHGRDLFAPAAARLAAGQGWPKAPLVWEACVGASWPEDLAEVVYLDGFGNAMLGVRAKPGRIYRVRVQGREIPWVRTFADVPRHQPLAYRNSLGLIEIAVREGSAAEMLGLVIGTPVEVR